MKYKMIVKFTVEQVLPSGGSSVRYHFEPHREDAARRLFDALGDTRGFLYLNQEDMGRAVIGINLIAWDADPSQDGAVGLLIKQEGWSEA